jgi:hypothetical protein
LVHACLQVTEQVWHPMHLSRFITIDICAMTLMWCSLLPRRTQYSTGAVRRRMTVTSSRWFPVGP